MMKKILSRIIVVSLVGLIFLLGIKLNVLQGLDYNSGKLLRTWYIEDEKFVVLYTHSVMLSQVTESYYIKDSYIFLSESSFKDYGAGLPSSTPYDFEFNQEKKIFRIYNIDEKMDPLVYKVGSPRADHKIKIGENLTSFSDFASQGSSVEFRSKRVSLLKYLLERGGKRNGQK